LWKRERGVDDDEEEEEEEEEEGSVMITCYTAPLLLVLRVCSSFHLSPD
jgi:hypothetical protein